MGDVVAIILARGGSKGIPKKNIVDFCGKPLMVWTIEQIQSSKGIGSIWVSSDSEEILSITQTYGCETIYRPADLSGDAATSELGWLHALGIVETKVGVVDVVVAPQVTSPLREPKDVERGLREFQEQKFDSVFSCSVVDDLYFWEKKLDGTLRSVNYDYNNRKRRQDISVQYIENGSFYLFKPEILRKYNNRFGGRIGMTKMEFWKMFQIDETSDLKLCEVIMRGYGLAK